MKSIFCLDDITISNSIICNICFQSSLFSSILELFDIASSFETILSLQDTQVSNTNS
ncbi:MAG: hypothetical protein P1U46_04210 [Patescibacteria group bacterium]|nr:hypothetical protein [Patescibacteria group bacterium]